MIVEWVNDCRLNNDEIETKIVKDDSLQKPSFVGDMMLITGFLNL